MNIAVVRGRRAIITKDGRAIFLKDARFVSEVVGTRLYRVLYGIYQKFVAGKMRCWLIRIVLGCVVLSLAWGIARKLVSLFGPMSQWYIRKGKRHGL